MNEKEKEILTTILEAYPKMTDFQRGYLLGMAEAMKEAKKDEKKGRNEFSWK